MNLVKALELVLELAEGGMISYEDARNDYTLNLERTVQSKAIDTVKLLLTLLKKV